VGLIGLGLVGGASPFALKCHQKRTNEFFSSLRTISNINLSRTTKINSYLLRGPMFKCNAPIYSLDLLNSFKLVAVLGANRSGKTISSLRICIHGGTASSSLLEDYFWREIQDIPPSMSGSGARFHQQTSRGVPSVIS